VTIRNTEINSFHYGIYLYYSSNNSISGNNIANNGDGIILLNSSHNSISRNNMIANRDDGIALRNSSSNNIFHNNFRDNTKQTYNETPEHTNSWDKGYPSGGNYWSGYIGVDEFSGPNQDQLGSDGIWDHPYVIDENNQDLYPLVNPWAPTPPTPDFSVTASPTSLTIQQDSSDTSAITVTSQNGFNQPVQLSVSGAPSGVTTTLNPEQVTPPPDGTATSTLTVSVDTTATTGSYTLTVTGTNGTITHSVDISLEITTLTLIPGKDVPVKAPDFFTSVSTRLNIPVSEYALQALAIWTNYENTNAYWNPLATTWDMGEKSWDFNAAGVQNYADKETGIQGTANTIALHYYEPIREMLAIQTFDEQQLREAVAIWSGLNPSDPYVVNLVDEWCEIYPVSTDQPPICIISLQKDGIEIDQVDVAEFFDIFAGYSQDDKGIKQIRF